MTIDQLYTGCLAQGAYYVESDGEAAIIDPLRETGQYVRRAEQAGARIKYIFETHFHADFVSGHLDLARKTGAAIVYGPNANTSYDIHRANDGEEFMLGRVRIRVLHTPGHTPESTTYLLLDEQGREHAIFTGDTLFIGDVGRPDLAIKGDLTEHDLAGMLYDSLHAKIMSLPDDVIVYPAHGAGSACGKNMSKETTDRLGNQKRFNYALQAKTREVFIEQVLDGLSKAPAYFAENARLNKEGYEPLDRVLQRGSQALAPEAFEAAVNETNALLLDVREAADFARGFIPNSINIGLNGSFAPWVGALIPDLKQPIALITPVGMEQETIVRLARVGYDNCIGFLEGGFAAWQAAGREVDTIESISAEVFVQRIAAQPDAPIVDVRKPTEFETGYVANAENRPLDTFNDHMVGLPRARREAAPAIYVHCAGGYRSMIASSILKARGFDTVVNVEGGMAAIKKIAPELVRQPDSVTH
jgi:hydroxyacylglutathione hydrolase